MTWAIIPNLRFSGDTAGLLREVGAPFLIHVPMQAAVDAPGRAGWEYCIGEGMGASEVRGALVPLLDSLDGEFGINNHRGSKATADRGVMNFVMDVLEERNLFFFDSRTSSASVAYKTALEHGLDAAYNSRFLDNESDRGKISAQMDGVLKSVRTRGMMAVICHLRPETVAFLEDFAGEIRDGRHKTGVEFITLSEWTEYAKGDKR
jgi:polysaccharide deacetylase 2 family uncharacterized protein YibQ